MADSHADSADRGRRKGGENRSGDAVALFKKINKPEEISSDNSRSYHRSGMTTSETDQVMQTKFNTRLTNKVTMHHDVFTVYIEV